MPELTPLGELLERSRTDMQLSKREAARRAGISEGRWRQVVSGEQRSGGIVIPVNPRPVTVIGMARAVGVDEADALRAAGISPGERAMFRTLVTGEIVGSREVDRLIAEIYASGMPTDEARELVRGIRRAEAARDAELRTAQDELHRWQSRKGA